MHTVGRDRSDDADNLGAAAELTEEEIAKAQAAFEAKFREVANEVLAARQRAAGSPSSVTGFVGRLLVDLGVGGIAGTVAGLSEGIGAIYDGHPAGIAFGTPAQARAFRALREGHYEEAGYFLRVHGRSGEDALMLDLLGSLPVAAFAAKAAEADRDRADPAAQEAARRPRFGDERDGPRPATFDAFSIPEWHAWCDLWVNAAHQVAEYQFERTRYAELTRLARGDSDESEEAAEVAGLSSEELLLMAAVDLSPRGFAEGDAATYQQVQTIRTRLRRREKNRSGVSE